MVAPQTTDTNFLSSLLAQTTSQYQNTLTDNVFNTNAALALLRQKSNVYFKTSGDVIQMPINLGKNLSVKSYTFYDSFDNSPQKGQVNANYGFANYGGFITISDDELDTNAGKEQIVNVLSSKLMICEESINDAINDDIYKDGTGNGSKDILGLAAMCETSATPGAYLGITDSTNWVNQYVTATAAAVLSGLTSLYLKCADGKEVPDIILANTAFVEEYESANRSASTGVGISYVNATLADAGFMHMNFKGIPMVIDKALDSAANDSGTYGKAFMLNSKFLALPYMEVKVGEFTDSNTQFAKVAKMRTRLQLLTNKRKRQGVMVLSN
jgi:hypothetical protein